MTDEKRPQFYRRRIPAVLQAAGSPRRSLHDAFVRALAVTSAMDAERHCILAIAFSHVFDVPAEKFEFALRKYRRGATLDESAEELQRAVKRRAPDA